MAGRAYWSGYLKLSLVSCQVKLYSATSASAGRISFNLLHKKTLNRVNQRYHDPELGEIAREDLVKGYQFEKDRYVVVTPEELDAIEIESSKTIDIEGFVNSGEIDRLYMDTPYYLAPEGPIAQETYKVILEAMKAAKKVALARVVLSGRERLVAIEPQEQGFLVSTIRSAKEVRKAAEYLEPIKAKVSPDMLAMAKQIIAGKTMKFDPDAFEDRYEAALLALVQSKIAGGEPVITKAPERGNVINLMDALKASLEKERRPAAPSLSKGGKEEKKKTAAIVKSASKTRKKSASS
jgi:DNA end-binding protein Ku